jgi:hypothetical protein
MRLTEEGYVFDDLVECIGTEDAEWFDSGCPIPYRHTREMWEKRIFLHDKIAECLARNEIRVIERKSTYVAPCVHINSDYLDHKGVMCPADGKTYDSKSAYYKAVKSKGLEIVGNDTITPAKQPEMDWRPAVAEAIKQLS